MQFNEILTHFLSTDIFPILGSVITYLVILMYNKFSAYIKLKYKVDLHVNIEKYAELAVRYVEEYTLAKAKGVEKLSSNEKLDAAITFLMKNCPEVDASKAKIYVEAALNRINLGASAKTDKE